jgi:MFS family permease
MSPSARDGGETPPSTAGATGVPLDRGRRAATTRPLLAGVAANLAAGTLFAWSLVAQDAATHVGLSPGGAAAVFATAIVVFSVVLLGVGPAQRRYGPRRLLYTAAGTGGAGLLLAATASGPLALWSGVALLFGTANGLGYGVAVGLAARAPHRRRGTATGLVVAAYAAGPLLLGLVAPSPCASSAGGSISSAWRSSLPRSSPSRPTSPPRSGVDLPHKNLLQPIHRTGR